MLVGKLQERVHLYHKFSVPHENGGLEEKWKLLGQFWAWPQPISLPYPLSHNGGLYFSGEAYLLIMRMDQKIFMAHRVVWGKKTFSVLSTPMTYKKNYYGIKIFSAYPHGQKEK